jgi:hypothetical protein
MGTLADFHKPNCYPLVLTKDHAYGYKYSWINAYFLEFSIFIFMTRMTPTYSEGPDHERAGTR